MDEKEALDYSKSPVITADDYEEEDMWEEGGCRPSERHRHFADEFDRSSPYYHGGDETPVPFDDMKIPNTMPTVYLDEDARLKQLYEEKMSLSCEAVDLLELESQALHHLKKQLTAVSDAIAFRLTQMAGKASGFLTAKIRATLADCRETLAKSHKLVSDDLHAAADKLLAEVDKAKGPTEAKESRRKLEKLQKELHAKQNEVIRKVKDIKQALAPDLKRQFDSIVGLKHSQVDSSLTDCSSGSQKAAEDAAEPSASLTSNN